MIDELAALRAQVALLDAQRARLGRLAEMMNALSSLSAQINTLDVGRVKDLCVTRIPPLARALGGALFTHDERTGELVLERHTQARLAAGSPRCRPRDDTLLERAVQSPEILVVQDLRAFEAALGAPPRRVPALAGVSRCCMLVPLRASQALVGVLALLDREDDGAFDVVNDLPPIQQVSQLLAAALRNVQLYEQVMAQSLTDSLTGLMNRRALWELLDQEIQRGTRYGHPLTVLLIDLDNFKRINDTLGHAAGDQVLCGVAAILEEQVRDVDDVARHGGDEFCVVLPETGLDGARIVARRILESIRAWTAPGGISPTCSIGIAALRGEMTPSDLIAAADRALYTVKGRGRNDLAVAE